jgi:hypothetical protein
LVLQPTLEGPPPLPATQETAIVTLTSSLVNKRRADVSLEQLVDNLIEAGWHVIDSDFDMAAFCHWRKQALDCIGALMGPAHAYTHYFKDFVEHAEKVSLLTGAGILIATKEQMAKDKPQSPTAP